MVADSASVESLTFHSGEANTEDIAHALKSGQGNILIAFAACLVLSLLLARHALRKLNAFTREAAAELPVAGSSYTLSSPRTIDAGAH